MSSNIASSNRAVLGNPSGITHTILLPPVRVEGGKGRQAAWGRGLGEPPLRPGRTTTMVISIFE